MRQAGLALGPRHVLDPLHRIAHQFGDRDRGIGHLVDERGVGAVLQQPAHQVGQQGLVRAHRRVDAARPAQSAFGLGADHLLVQRLAHAVQALELVLPRRVALGTGHVVDRGQRVRVVGGELRVRRVGRIQQLARAGQVRQVGVRLARVHRVVSLPVDLGPLDLGIPVRALDQPHHQTPAAAPGQVDDEVGHLQAALLVGLDHESESVPSRQLRLERQPLQQVQRQLQPVGLLGVDVEADVVAAGQRAQAQQDRVQLAHHAVGLRAHVARMQRRQLHRQARPLDDPLPGGRLADRVDRGLVVAQVALRVLRRHRRFAQHVERMAESLRLPRPRVGERLFDRLAGDELLAHHPHRHVDALADHGLAAGRDQARRGRRQPGLAVGGNQFAREQQAPGGGIDEQRPAAPQVRVPLALRDLVADQRVARRRVGDAQQGLGQAHQGDALLRRERVFLQKALHQAGAPGRRRTQPQARGQRLRQALGARGDIVRQARQRQQGGHRLGLWPPGRGGDGAPQRRRGERARGGEVPEQAGGAGGEGVHRVDAS